MSWLSKATGIHVNIKPSSIIGMLPIPGAGLIGTALDAGMGSRGGGGGSVPNVPGIDWKHPLNPGSDPFGLGMTAQAGQPVNGRCAPGWHVNKHPLAACKSHGAVDAGMICVRNRHMNPANGRAIGRSVRRIKAGEKQYRKVFTILHHKAAGKFLPRTRKK